MFFGCRIRLDSGSNPRGRIGDFFSTGLFAAIGCRLRDALYRFWSQSREQSEPILQKSEERYFFFFFFKKKKKIRLGKAFLNLLHPFCSS